MSVNRVDYVVAGVAITGKEAVSAFFDAQSKLPGEQLEGYGDNEYKEKITKNASVVHVIQDGMNCDYIVIGRILVKERTEGFPIAEVGEYERLLIECRKTVQVEIRKIEVILDLKLPIAVRVIHFTHWH